MAVEKTTSMALTRQAEWDHYGNRGDSVVRRALTGWATNLSVSAPAEASLAMGFGALKAVGEYLRVVANPDGIAVLEQNAMAYLRGALRGADGPILDNGKPFIGASDA